MHYGFNSTYVCLTSNRYRKTESNYEEEEEENRSVEYRQTEYLMKSVVGQGVNFSEKIPNLMGVLNH